MRRKFYIWLTAALVCGLGLSLASCKDDSNDGKSEEQKEQEAQEKASKFWDVVGQLVSVDDVTDDYAGKTFEPTYGIADSSDPLTRIVNTNDMKTAAQRFANLVGVTGIDENTPSYTWNDPDVGTMTYTRGGTAAEWATVDVDIKAVPHLQKIIYRVGSEGDNGSFEGRAYYRFGDVVSRQVTVTYNEKKNNDRRGTITEYWICVRPAFGPEGKEDSHWVCVNTVGDKNYKYYKASTGTDYWLPTNLGTNKENMQNFAEMLWAICYPENWRENVTNFHEDGTLWGFSGMPFFTDFKGKNLKYHNEAFWKNVQKGWEGKQVAEKALNLPNLGALLDKINADGVHLLYKGYSWWFTTSWNCELWEAVYTNGTTNAEKNMHHAVYNEEVERNMKDYSMDVRTMGEETDNYKYFFNNDGKLRWVIRHATGKELASNGKFDVQQPIQGVNEVYRYYTEYPEEWSRKTEEEDKPEITQGNNDASTWNLNDYSGLPFYEHGDVLVDKNGHKWFVINQAGNPDNLAYDMIGEKMPFAELICFEGLDISPDKKTAMNLPSRDEAIRAIFRLEMFYTQTSPTGPIKKQDKAQWQSGGQYSQWGSSLYNVLEEARVEIRDLLQLICAQNRNPRQSTHAASVAYDDGSGRMRLLRYIMNNQNQKEEMKMYLWDHYVMKPDSTTMLYPANAYSNVPIYLDDLTNQQMVTTYAEDTYARQGLSVMDNMEVNTAETPRKPRSAPDPRAGDAGNCIYNINTWRSRTFVADMWNSPILMFRFTRIYDRGADDHASVAVNGLKMKHVRHHEWGEFAEEDQQQFRAMTMTVQYKNCITPGDWKLDGKDFTFPLWHTLYKTR